MEHASFREAPAWYLRLAVILLSVLFDMVERLSLVIHTRNCCVCEGGGEEVDSKCLLVCAKMYKLVGVSVQRIAPCFAYSSMTLAHHYTCMLAHSTLTHTHHTLTHTHPKDTTKATAYDDSDPKKGTNEEHEKVPKLRQSDFHINNIA